MSNCNGCFNGCSEITSDQCVRYTGDSIEDLGIETNDPYSSVVEKITDYLLTVMSGEGISPVIPPGDICTIVDGYLGENPTLVEVLTALVQTACDLQAQIDETVEDIATIEGNYVVGCLTGVVASSGTHAILQAVITKICAMAIEITALQTALSQYVPIDEIDDYIEEYLEGQGSTKYYTKLIPYQTVPFFPPDSSWLANFPGGVGINDWEQIYLCDGRNGTPDLRGRILVGANEMSCASYNGDAETDPAFPANPDYDLGDVEGSNKITLSVAQMPAHKHTVAAPTVVDPGHRHLFGGDRTAITPMGFEKYNDVATGYDVNADNTPPIDYGAIPFYTKSSSNQVAQSYQTTGISVSVPDTSFAGSSNSHNNVPPVRACYYVIYIPT